VGNLSELTQSPVVTAIYEWWQDRGKTENPRRYLGGSEIGHHCERYLWYKFRGSFDDSFDGRLYRLFNRGHREEAVFVEELRGIGCEVYECDEDGQQFEVVAIDEHFKGHADAVCRGVPGAEKTWHLVEMKTFNSKDFAKLQKEGVEKHKPQHFAQMQVYMHLLELTRALYLAVNKDNDELYAERIKAEKTAAETLLKRADRIIRSPEIPPRPYPRSDYYLCKWCPAQNLCWGEADEAVPVPSLDCRQCCHATPIEGGQWRCERGKDFGTPCKDHLFLPGYLETEGTPVDAGNDRITYEARDGFRFIVGPDFGKETEHVRSLDLICMPKALLLSRPAEDAGGENDHEYKNKENQYGV